MKEYFFLKGKDQNGPFTIEQLSGKGLTSETLIWTEGMENWQKLKDIPELFQALKPKSVPPPPPTETEEKISKTQVSGQLKVTTEKTPNTTLKALKPNQNTLTWLIVWCGFHLFALLMSYSEVKFFNNSGKPKKNKFWPFVKYNDCAGKYDLTELSKYFKKDNSLPDSNTVDTVDTNNTEGTTELSDYLADNNNTTNNTKTAQKPYINPEKDKSKSTKLSDYLAGSLTKSPPFADIPKEAREQIKSEVETPHALEPSPNIYTGFDLPKHQAIMGKDFFMTGDMDERMAQAQSSWAKIGSGVAKGIETDPYKLPTETAQKSHQNPKKDKSKSTTKMNNNDALVNYFSKSESSKKTEDPKINDALVSYFSDVAKSKNFNLPELPKEAQEQIKSEVETPHAFEPSPNIYTGDRLVDKDKKHSENGDWMEVCFNGVFSEYDWTEFAFYVGGSIVIYLLVRVSNKKEESTE